MKSELEIRVDKARLTIYCKMSGIFTEPDMQKCAEEFRKATDAFQGKRHLVLADMRGMKPTHPKVAAILGEVIAYGRRNGCVRCAHLSDDTVQRLQAARVARMATPDDDVTVVVNSIEEGEQVLEEARRELAHNRAVSPADEVAKRVSAR